MSYPPTPHDPADGGPSDGPDQSPPPTSWPLWLAAGIVVFLTLIALGQ